MATPNIVVLNPHPLVRSLIEARLGYLGAISRGAETQDQALQLLHSEQADLMIFDLFRARAEETVEFIGRVRKQNPRIGLVILTSVPEPRLLGLDANKLPKDLAYINSKDPRVIENLTAAIMEAMRGKYPRELRQHLQPRHALSGLSNSQLNVLVNLANGLSNQAIATQRGTTVRAVENLIKRTLDNLSIEAHPSHHSRVLASRIYLETIGST